MQPASGKAGNSSAPGRPLNEGLRVRRGMPTVALRRLTNTLRISAACLCGDEHATILQALAIVGCIIVIDAVVLQRLVEGASD